MNSKNKKIIIIISVILILFGIYMLYNTFAVSTIASKSEDNIYDIIAGEGTTITVPKGNSKTIYFHLKNTNNGSVKYALGYNTTANIEVKVYEDSKDKTSDIIGYTENKYIKLYLNNTSTTDNTVTITSVLGYENGGDLIVPDGITLVTEVYTPPKITEPTVVLSDYITNLYTSASKSTATNNSIKYNYASSVNLMNDRLGSSSTSVNGGNIRYYGASPNNYIYFNCSNYYNQTSDTCELWRIIGVFDGKVKIMRNEQIGAYSWDTSASDVNSGYGVNEWSQADLMKLLNPGYSSESVGGSLYYNGESGTCFSGENNATTSCDFTSTGIKNKDTRNKIAEVTWNLGGWDTMDIYSNQIYNYERGTTVVEREETDCSTASWRECNDTVIRATIWNGKIALPYPSDYSYAADLSLCNKTLYEYENDDETSSGANWMYPILTGINTNLTNVYYGWLLTPATIYSFRGWAINLLGSVIQNGADVDDPYGVIPTLYLSSDESIFEGNTGSINDPYKLSP